MSIKQSSSKILRYPSSFLLESHSALTLNEPVSSACNGCHQNLWQIYNTGLVENYATWLYRHKISYWSYFDKIIKLMVLFSAWWSSLEFFKFPFYKFWHYSTWDILWTLKTWRGVKTTSLILPKIPLLFILHLFVQKLAPVENNYFLYFFLEVYF